MDSFQTDDVKSIMARIMNTLNETTSTEEVPPEPVHASSRASSQGKSCLKESRTVKPQDFVNKTWSRMIAKHTKTQESLKQQREAQATETFRPNINSSSRTMVGRAKPIQHRVPQIIEERKNRLAWAQGKLAEERKQAEDKDLTFQPTFLTKLPSERRQDFYQYSVDWKEHKLLSDEIRRLEVTPEEPSFRPSIDKHSSELARSQTAAEDRLLAWGKKVNASLQHKRDNPEHPFTPTITEKARKLTKSRDESNVFSRLFQSQQDSSELRSKVEDTLQFLLQASNES